MRALIAAAKTAPSVSVVEGATGEELIVEDGRVIGAMAGPGDILVPFLASAVVLATGAIRLSRPSIRPRL